MSLATYSDLVTSVGLWLNYTPSNIDDHIAMCEQVIAYGSKEPSFECEPLRIRAMETSADLSLVGGTQTVALPTGFLQQRRLYISSSPNIEVDFVEPNLFWNTWLSGTSGPPAEYTVEGENIVFGPIPDTSYTGKILYYKKLTGLSSVNATNWILTNTPGIYVQGILSVIFRFMRNMPQAQASFNTFAGLINALNATDKKDRYTGPWTARSDTGNP